MNNRKKLRSTSGSWSVKKLRIVLLAGPRRRLKRPKTAEVMTQPAEQPTKQRQVTATGGLKGHQQTENRSETDWKQVALDLLEGQRQLEEPSTQTVSTPVPRPTLPDRSTDWDDLFERQHRWDVYTEITSKPFDPRCSLRMVDFFVKQFDTMRSLMLPITEMKMVSDLMELFPRAVWIPWCLLDRKERTLQRAQKYLLDINPCIPRDDAERSSSSTQVSTPAVSPLPTFNPFSIPPPNLLGNVSWTY
ncbi:uncharacterized protein LOC135137438 [Zophobas morio]|uniref:uncharacterized protein LOC135137438 n=1 Tax=Zophobas morio TaxID=2755281 RepID=UPI003083E0DF